MTAGSASFPPTSGPATNAPLPLRYIYPKSLLLFSSVLTSAIALWAVTMSASASPIKREIPMSAGRQFN